MTLLKAFTAGLALIGVIFMIIGNHTENERFGPFTISAIVCFSIGLILAIIGLINSLN